MVVAAEPASLGSTTAVDVARGQVAWRRFRRNRLAVAGLAVLALLALAALAAPALTDVGALADPLDLDAASANSGPSTAHLLGTDSLGRDLLARTVYGARISLSIAALAQLIVLVLGGSIGLVAGWWGGWLDSALMRVTDVMYTFPDLLFALVVAATLQPGYWSILLGIGLVRWVFLARLVRGEVLLIKSREFIEAGQAIGTRPARLLSRHVIPHLMAPVIVTLSFGIPAAIFIEAFLSFVGVGVPAPTPSWGVMIDEGYEAIFAHPVQVVAPAVAISLATLACNFIGDGLRDALDPRLSR